MFTSSLRRLAGPSLLAGALLAAAALPAQAIVYVGHFDPAFGPGVPNLGFRGTVQFSIPNACLAKTGVISNADPCANGAMQDLNAKVEFYNTTDPLQATLATQLFADQPLVDAVLSGGALVGPDSLAIHATGVQVLNPDTSVLFQGDLWLQFLTVANQPNAYLYSCDPATPCAASTVSNPAPVVLSALPEPTSVALVLAALGAGGMATRRRRAA